MSYRRLSALVTVATLAFGGTFVVAPLFLPESATVVKAADIGPNSTVFFNDLTQGYDKNAAIRIRAALKGVDDALDIYEQTSNEVGGIKSGKTVAAGFTGVRPDAEGDPDKFDYNDEIETFSGWIDPKNSESLPKSKINGFLSPATLVPIVQNIIKSLSIFGYSGSSSLAFDQGVPGRYFASHAEKQMLAELESGLAGGPYGGAAAIGVSRPMCQDCQYFYAFEARRIAKDFVVGGAAPGEAGDPGPSNRQPTRRVARYFHSDGRVDVISQQPDGLYQVKIYSAAQVKARYDAGLQLN